MEAMQTNILQSSEFNFILIVLPVSGLIYDDKEKYEDEIMPVFYPDQRLLIFRRLGKSALIESPAG